METTSPFVKNLTDGPLLKQLILFSLPMIAGNLIQAAYAAVDLAIVGNAVGANGLSVLGIGTIIYNLLLMTATGLAFGGQILLAQQVGAKSYHTLADTIGTMLTLTFLSGVVLSLVGVVASPALLQLLNTPGEVSHQVQVYCCICCCGLIFAYGNNCIYAILRGLGNAKLPAILIGITAVLNIVLDVILIPFLRLGTNGAAIALVMSQGMGLVGAILYMMLRHRELLRQLRWTQFRLTRSIVIPIIKLSMPLIVYGLLMSVSSIFVNSNVNVYGIAFSAVDSISEKLKALASAVTTGIYMGGGEIIAQCFGAGKAKRIQKAFRDTILLGVAGWGGIAAIMVVFVRNIFLVFTLDTEVLSMSSIFVWIAILNYLGMALGTGTFALLEGVGNTTLEMISGIIENLIVKILLGMIFGGIWGAYGYWFGCAAASFTMPVIGVIYYKSGCWKRRMAVLQDQKTTPR